MTFNPIDTDESRTWDVLRESETDLLVELDDLRAEIALRQNRLRVVVELLAAVRDRISQRAVAKKMPGLP